MPDDFSNSSSWIEYRRAILEALARLEADAKSTHEKIDSLKTEVHDRINTIRNEDIAALKVEIATIKGKAVMLGAVTAFLVSLGILTVGVIALVLKHN